MGLFGNRNIKQVKEYCQFSTWVYEMYKDFESMGAVGMPKGIKNSNPSISSLQSDLDISLGDDRVEPLEFGLKEQLEKAFGTDLSTVKIHTGPKADEMTRRAGAEAFAIGNNIFFGGGRFNPHSQEGLKLLVHEIQHVVQHSSGERMVYVEDIDELEAQAERVEEMLDTHALHNITQPIFQQDEPSLNPKDQSRNMSESALFKSEGAGGGGNMDDFRDRQKAPVYKVHFPEKGKSYILTPAEREAVLELTMEKINQQLSETISTTDTKTADQLLVNVLHNLKGGF